VPQIGGGEALLHPQEAEVHRARAQPAEVVEQALLVVGTDGTYVDRPAVAQHAVDGQGARVGGGHDDSMVRQGQPGRKVVRSPLTCWHTWE